MEEKMTKINLKPTPGYVLIEQEETVRKTSSGIVLPESHEDKPSKGKVLAVGKAESCDCKDKGCIEVPCKAGDVVIYKKWGGNEYKVNDKEYMFIKFEDILAIEE
jgi:chaperonin GroES